MAQKEIKMNVNDNYFSTSFIIFSTHKIHVTAGRTRFMCHTSLKDKTSLHSKIHAQKVQMYCIQPPMYQTKFCRWKIKNQNWQNNVATSQDNTKPLLRSTLLLFTACLLMESMECKIRTWLPYESCLQFSIWLSFPFL